MLANSFTPRTSEWLQRLCRLTDGAEANRYSLNQFLQLMNQQALYSLYQPRLPNDLGFIRNWAQYLQTQNVDFVSALLLAVVGAWFLHNIFAD